MFNPTAGVGAPPVASYAFNEASGATTTADASGNGNTGVLLKRSCVAPGKNGNGVNLDGVNDYVDLGNGASFNITGSLSIDAWIYSSSFPFDDAAIVSKMNNNLVGFQLDTTIDQGPRTIGFKLANSFGNYTARYGATALQLNTWYHIAGVYNLRHKPWTSISMVNSTMACCMGWLLPLSRIRA